MDQAGAPHAIVAGVGTAQSSEFGTAFAVPLAVTEIDGGGNVLTGASATPTAPATEAGGHFVLSGTTATVLTNSDRVATAPDFAARQLTGGYVATAPVAGLATPAAFGLVNKPRPDASAAGPDRTHSLITSTGTVLRSGGTANYGSVKAKLGSPVDSTAATPDNVGDLVVTAKGAVYPFGDAKLYRSPAKIHLAKPSVGITSALGGEGYWLVASDGGTFNCGAAINFGPALARSPGRSKLLSSRPMAPGTGW
jgi:hypothetical protein